MPPSGTKDSLAHYLPREVGAQGSPAAMQTNCAPSVHPGRAPGASGSVSVPTLLLLPAAP